MKELFYVELIKKIISRHYEKDMAFYDAFYDQVAGKWYSRLHSRYITLEELEDWVLDITDIDL